MQEKEFEAETLQEQHEDRLSVSLPLSQDDTHSYAHKVQHLTPPAGSLIILLLCGSLILIGPLCRSLGR